MKNEFIEGRTQKDRALQTAIRAFAILRYGGSLTPDQAKTLIDMCSLALPGKYRFPRSVWEQWEKGRHPLISPRMVPVTERQS